MIGQILTNKALDFIVLCRCLITVNATSIHSDVQFTSVKLNISLHKIERNASIQTPKISLILKKAI